MTNPPWYHVQEPDNPSHTNHVMGQKHPSGPAAGSYRSPYDRQYAQQAVVPPSGPYHTVHQPFPGPTAMPPLKRFVAASW